MQQSLKILQFAQWELEQYLREEEENNPVLEIVWPMHEEKTQGSYDNAHYTVENVALTLQSLGNYLEDQLRVLSLSPTVQYIARYIVGNLDDYGYLTLSLEEIKADLQCPMQQVHEALVAVQSLEPAGVGARSLKECLMLQMSRLQATDTLMWKLVSHYGDQLTSLSVPKISKLLKVPPAIAQHVLSYLGQLDPKPGRAFSNDPVPFLVPDLIATKDSSGKPCAIAYDAVHPVIHTNPAYYEMGQHSSDPAVKQFLRNAFQQAYSLRRALAHRIQTLETIASYIVDRQSRFCFDQHPRLLPLSVNEIAQDVGLHPSTVRRAMANKFIACPQGILPISGLLSEAIGTTAQVSVHSVKEILRHIIRQEPPHSPYTDAALQTKLAEQEMIIARRTVAKYREELGIPPANKRRTS